MKIEELRVLTNTSTKTIWEHLSSGLSIETLLDAVPDEFYDWVHSVIAQLESEFQMWENRAEAAYDEIVDSLPVEFERKDFAAKAINNYPDLSDILFKMLDNFDYDRSIWKKIQPEYSKPFTNDGDNDGKKE